MRKFRNRYIKPKKLWSKARLSEEKEIKKRYGLKNMREIWRAEYKVKKIRQMAKKLITASPEAQKEFISKLASYGFIKNDALIDDVLALDKTKILDRRLQTIVYKLGLANTIKHARQLITHGHVYLSEKRVNTPGYIVKIDEEDKISLEKSKKSERESASKHETSAQTMTQPSTLPT
ncbi:MAG: 30S ribosomal protein S4 [Candidatus Pacearchaeota archaeon]